MQSEGNSSNMKQYQHPHYQKRFRERQEDLTHIMVLSPNLV